MITPSFSLAATERVLPRLALDFTTGTLDPRVTVTRALNTATRVNSSGFIEVVNADLPRFDYSPTTLQPKGLLIEEQRANLLLQSNNFATTWAWDGGSAGTRTQNAVSPEGTVNAWTIADTSASFSQAIQQQISLTAVNHTFSCYFKKTTGVQSTYPVIYAINAGNLNAAFCTVDTSNGIATPWTAYTGITIVTTTTTCTDAGDYWRVTLTFLGQSAFWLFRIVPAATTNATQSTGTLTANLTGSTVIYGAQLEAGAFATSYIPTTTTSLTRNADVVSMTGTNFSDWYNASEGTFVTWFDTNALLLGSTKSYTVISANAGNTSNQISPYVYSNFVGAQIRTGGVSQADINGGGSPLNNALIKVSIAYAANNVAATVNGAAPGTDASATIPTVDRLSIGNVNSALQLNGHIQIINYYPLRLTNSEVRAFSK